MNIEAIIPVRIMLVADPDQIVPGELFRRVNAVCVGRLSSWNDLLAIGPELNLQAVLWLNPPAGEESWIKAITQLSRIRPTLGVVIVPKDTTTIGPMKAEILARRERGQFHNVTAAPGDIPGLLNGLRKVLAEQGLSMEQLGREPQLRMMRPASSDQGKVAGADVRLLRNRSHTGYGALAGAVAPRVTEARIGRIVSVLGARGGAGQTTVSVGLACIAAQEMPRQVVLVDLDRESADVAVHLDLMDEPDLVDLLPHLEAEVPYEKLSLYGDRLYVIPGPARPDLGALVTPDAVEKMLKCLSATFPLTIVDTGASSDDEVTGRAIELATDLLLVLTPDASSLRLISLRLDQWERSGWRSKPITAVINQAYEHPPLQPERIAAFLGVDIHQLIPMDRAAVDRAVLSGKPLVVSQPNHPIARSLMALGIQLELVRGQGRTSSRGIGVAQRLKSWLRRETPGGPVDWPSRGR